MKKIKFSFIIICVLLFSSCKTESNSNIVKYVFFDTEDDLITVSIKCYDFSSEKEEYKSFTYSAEDYFALAAKINQDKGFDLKRCEYCFMSPSVIEKNMDGLFKFLKNMKFPSNIKLACTDSEIENISDFNLDKSDIYHMYDLSFNEKNISGCIPKVKGEGGSDGAVLISSGKVITDISNEEWEIIKLLKCDAKNIKYSFGQGEYTANLESCNTYFSNDNSAMLITLNCVLKSYKGMSADEKSRQLFISLLKTDMSANIYSLYSDISVSQLCNLHWFSKQQGKDLNEITVKINIL